MARTAAGARLTREHRTQQLALRAAVISELSRLWPVFDVRNFATYARFLDLAQLLITARHADSTALAARYFTRFRRAERVLEGDARPLLADSIAPERIRVSMRATGLKGTINGLRSGFTLDGAARHGFVLAAGAASRLVLDGGRQTILESTRVDQQARRWQRVTSADPCHFCAMIASRGAVFSADTAGFEAHDHCACEPEPVYDGSKESGRNQQFRDLWNESTQGLGGPDAVNAFRAAVEGRAT